MPAGGACDAPPAPALTTTAWGPFLTATGPPVPGAVSYLFTPAGPRHQHQPCPSAAAPPASSTPACRRARGTSASRRSSPAAPTAPSARRCSTSTARSLQDGAAGAGSAPGRRRTLELRCPASSATSPPPTRAICANSCLSTAATTAGCSASSSALRERDKRWGLNWKRANVGDMSQDVITFNWGPDPDEGTLQAARVGHHRRPLRTAAGLAVLGDHQPDAAQLQLRRPVDAAAVHPGRLRAVGCRSSDGNRAGGPVNRSARVMYP